MKHLVFGSNISPLSMGLEKRNSIFFHTALCRSVQFSSVQFKMVSMRSEKSISAPPRLRSFPNVTYETGPMFVSIDNDPSYSIRQ